jgi:RimJ/RimL family protein N-acetyltransferase
MRKYRWAIRRPACALDVPLPWQPLTRSSRPAPAVVDRATPSSPPRYASSVPTHRVTYEPLTPSVIPEVAAALDDDRVYRFIGGRPPRSQVEHALRKALAGPAPDAVGEVWLNIVVRDPASDAVLGRLEATIHHGIAEVAFLYAPRHWGKGWATDGLRWLHTQLRARSVVALWATVAPRNAASAALLARGGYQPVPCERRPLLYSYEAGDLVFTARNDGRHPAPRPHVP